MAIKKNRILVVIINMPSGRQKLTQPTPHLSTSEAAQSLTGLNSQEKPALDYFYRRYFQRLAFYLHSLVQDTSVAEEIANDVFLKLWNEAPDNPFASENGVWAFLRVASRNAAFDHLKALQRFKRNRNAFVSLFFRDTFVAGPDNAAVWVDVIEQLHAALMELPEQQREVMRLNQQGLTTTEIAKTMNLTDQTVRNYRGLAIKTLRRKLTPMATTLILLHSLYNQLFR